MTIGWLLDIIRASRAARARISCSLREWRRWEPAGFFQRGERERAAAEREAKSARENGKKKRQRESAELDRERMSGERCRRSTKMHTCVCAYTKQRCTIYKKEMVSRRGEERDTITSCTRRAPSLFQAMLHVVKFHIRANKKKFFCLSD